MKEIDWSKAPEGATHAGMTDNGKVCWYIISPDSSAYKFQYGTDGAWGTNEGSIGPRHAPLTPRPQKPTPWQGPQDGLPPDGTECEVSNCGRDFEWCLIKYMGSHLCVVDHKTHKDQHYHLSSVVFRPIQSEMDKAVAKIVDDLSTINLAESSTTGVACRLHELGYRKPMSRAEANNAISIALRDVPFSIKHRTALLNALGYKEPIQ